MCLYTLHTHTNASLSLSIRLSHWCVHLRTAYTIKIKLNFVSMSLLCIFYLHRIASLQRSLSLSPQNVQCDWPNCVAKLAKKRFTQNIVDSHIHFLSLVLNIMTAHSGMKQPHLHLYPPSLSHPPTVVRIQNTFTHCFTCDTWIRFSKIVNGKKYWAQIKITNIRGGSGKKRNN